MLVHLDLASVAGLIYFWRLYRVTPIVLGAKPKLSKDHSAVLVKEDRILVIKKGSTSDDCIWFLEVGIFECFSSLPKSQRL